ncbi:DUF2271 domain-containing protein [Colwellia sp. D2M02]|uniref:DUF2271 domain-containing protein n=1 Tax=Colwellia sp. D2M02 TaxID=2841562 RepID=UPI001C08047D|nr:DUF2271 domain-containing protein [Colwellia sp. D2M02]MBU2891837.1 DUF2271 domain-containing protein [Colwellia sp. D2M02]
MNKQLLLAAFIASATIATPVLAKEITVDFSLPEFSTQDYNKPYVAIWTEAQGKNDTLLLWHLTKRDEDKWLVDIRRWWRKVGRYGDLPADGVTGATKGPGEYSVTLDIGELTEFNLMIEVVREDGGRSLLRQKINSQKNQKYTLEADAEIGNVTINVGK